jgi:hypothetical protein
MEFGRNTAALRGQQFFTKKFPAKLRRNHFDQRVEARFIAMKELPTDHLGSD